MTVHPDSYITLIERCFANQSFIEVFCGSAQVALLFYEFRRVSPCANATYSVL